MRSSPLIVLKLGGSVLTSEDHLAPAVGEVYRWSRRGWRVVVVVSALRGTTNRLCQRAERFLPDNNPHAAARLIEIGERESAALLSLALGRAGVSHELLSPDDLGLRAVGSALDARPMSVRRSRIERTLERGRVVVCAGFVGRDKRGRVVLLGRGGSDLTAIFLAKQLGADRCRLIKDVAGVHPEKCDGSLDPSRLYRSISWNDLELVGEQVIQRKALEYAKRSRQIIEIGTAGARDAARVGGIITTLEPVKKPARPLRIALLGYGTVGGGFYERLQSHRDRFEVVSIGVRDIAKAQRNGAPKNLLHAGAEKAALTECDVVVEAIGGVNPAKDIVRSALETGKSVVTANKSVVASAGRELVQAARQSGARLKYSAAVGGSCAILEAIENIRTRRQIVRLAGVLNGSCNFILERCLAGETFQEAIVQTQQLGFAEADPSRDLLGQDTADKLTLLVHAITDQWIDPVDIPCEPITPAIADRCRLLDRTKVTLKQVGRVWFEHGKPRASVTIETLPKKHPLAEARGAQNIAVVETADESSATVRGVGAGRHPTVEAMLADLMDLACSASDAAPDDVPDDAPKVKLCVVDTEVDCGSAFQPFSTPGMRQSQSPSTLRLSE